MHKYHYLYKITNIITQEYYYGVHSTNDLNDGYFGSGSQLKHNIQIYGRPNFSKEILEFFPDRKSLMLCESKIVNKQLLKDKKCLNVILGGGELKGSIGKKCIIDSYGNYKMVDKNNNENCNFFVGRICINKNGKMKYIKPYELSIYEQNGWTKGTIYNSPGKGKIWVRKLINGEKIVKQILPDELQQYLDEGWEKGFKNNRIFVNKNHKCKQIPLEELQQYLDEGWEKGSGEKTINNLVAICKEEIIKYIEPSFIQQYLDEGWVKRTWRNTIWVNNKIDNKRINKKNLQQYLDEGWVKGKVRKSHNNTKSVYIYDLNYNLVEKFNTVNEAVKSGYNNIKKYIKNNKIYKNKYIFSYTEIN